MNYHEFLVDLLGMKVGEASVWIEPWFDMEASRVGAHQYEWEVGYFDGHKTNARGSLADLVGEATRLEQQPYPLLFDRMPNIPAGNRKR